MKIDGKKIRDEILLEIGNNLAGKSICFIQFQDDPIAKKFVESKQKIATYLGVTSNYIIIPVPTTEDAIKTLNNEIMKGYSGIVIQLPLPQHLDQTQILSHIPTSLDIDLLNEKTIDLFKNGSTSMIPPVARAISTIFEKENIDLKNKTIVIIGRGKLVGLPLSILFDNNRISYSIFGRNSNQEEMMKALLMADIIISGIGVPSFIQPTMIKQGVILIDAGTSEQQGVTVGDIDPSCYEKASLYTPVPGGVGPITVASIFQNLQ